MQNKVRELLQDLGSSKISNVAYDTAWISHTVSLGEYMGKNSLDWIRDHQLSDGTWGAEKFRHNHDRVICTLAAIIALAKYGTDKDKIRVKRARYGLDFAIRGLMADTSGATVGFEMLLPSLLNQAYEAGALQRSKDLDPWRYTGKSKVHKNKQRVNGGMAIGRADDLAEIRIQSALQKKLAAQSNGKFDRNVSMVFSAELAGEQLSIIDIDNIQEIDGSLAKSPSATAYFATKVRVGDSLAMAYLRDVSSHSVDGGIPHFHPFDTYEIAWSLWNLALLNLNKELLFMCKPHLDKLSSAWTSQGMSYASGCSIFDGDDTTVAFEVLTRFGYEVDVRALLSYEENNYFRCYDFESDPSIGVNIHALGALREYGYEVDHPAIQKILHFLEQKFLCDSFWYDKWHSSPYYSTAHAIIAIAGYARTDISQSINWIIETQNGDGSWGFYRPTAEETAYCLQALLILQRHGEKVPSDILKRGLDYLSANMDPPYEPLWLGKCLYTPELVVRSAVLSALVLGEES
ncbi:MAG: hypothetical protein ISR58_11700 [Anaerolineales bacterium]|nr:hypothetical protein [Chloroflexota bacterium]MBL6981840.1 hypothetical protein [Anaerolineales bacterium]